MGITGEGIEGTETNKQIIFQGFLLNTVANFNENSESSDDSIGNPRY